MQGQAGGYLERLHKMVVSDLNLFLDGGKDQEEWPKFRENLIGPTDVTLVTALEEGPNSMLADCTDSASHSSLIPTDVHNLPTCPLTYPCIELVLYPHFHLANAYPCSPRFRPS